MRRKVNPAPCREANLHLKRTDPVFGRPPGQACMDNAQKKTKNSFVIKKTTTRSITKHSSNHKTNAIVEDQGAENSNQARKSNSSRH